MSVEQYTIPYLGKQLAWWQAAYNDVDTTEPEAFADRFVLACFEGYCRKQEPMMRHCFESDHVSCEARECPSFRPAKPDYQIRDPRSRSFAEVRWMHDLRALPCADHRLRRENPKLVKERS